MTEDFEMAIRYEGKAYLRVVSVEPSRCTILCDLDMTSFCAAYCVGKGQDALCNIGCSPKWGYFKEVKL